MSFFSTWLRQGNEIIRLRMEVEFLTRERDEYSSLLDREEQRNALLASALTKESSDHKRTLRRVADDANKQLGLPQHYVKDALAPVPQSPPGPEESPDEQFVLWQAKAQFDADVEAGITPAPIEEYEAVIRQNPGKYIIG